MAVQTPARREPPKCPGSALQRLKRARPFPAHCALTRNIWEALNGALPPIVLVKCPLPVLKTRKAMETMAPGQVLKLRSDMEGGVKCLPVWSDKSGHPIVKTEREGPVYVYYLRRS